jgi:predicted AAA+ superfamily ATPase
VRTSKLFFVDSGIAADQLSQDETSLQRLDSPLGALLEGFVTSEIARQLTWSRTRAEIFHYRTKDQVEVDIVLEDRRGRVIAIEVKAAATVRAEDFRGIDHLAQRTGDDLVTGIVFYTGQHTLSFGPKKLAVPISALWESQQ